MDQRCAPPGVMRHRMPVWLIRTAVMFLLVVCDGCGGHPR